MELELIRRYFPNGSNGSLFCGDTFICHTIELPWKDNERSTSCIPEGRYQLVSRYSPRFKWHLLVKNVPGRSVILIHPANDAMKELKGCIAPVCELTGEGRGNASQRAMQHLMELVNKAIEEQPTLLLTISAAVGTYTNTNHERGD